MWGQGKLGQHSLTLLAAGGRATAWMAGTPAPAMGRYLLKGSVDAGNRLAADWKAVLGEGGYAYAGRVEVTSDWPAG